MKTQTRIFTAAMTITAFALRNAAVQAAPPRLLPFQGRLTDASGAPVSDGAKVVQFKIYDAPTGGTAVWNGEVQKVTVNGGLVSTLLGSKADLSTVDFNQALYLEITVDANADSQITAADPPLLPRQSILPAVFAVEAQSARTLKAGDGQNYDWSALFGTQSPASGAIPLNRVSIPNGGIPAAAITANDSITANQLAPNAVDTSELKDNSVTSAKLDSEVATSIIPPGSIIAFGGAGDAVPAGWLLCDGRIVSRTTYPRLFNYIGTYWGAGSDATTFRLPDLRGRFLRGVDDSPVTGITGRDADRLSRIAPGTTDPSSKLVGSSQEDELLSHKHQWRGTDNTSYGGGTPPYAGFAFDRGLHFISSTSPQDAPQFEILATGGSETRPKNVYVFYIIRY